MKKVDPNDTEQWEKYLNDITNNVLQLLREQTAFLPERRRISVAIIALTTILGHLANSFPKEERQKMLDYFTKSIKNACEGIKQ